MKLSIVERISPLLRLMKLLRNILLRQSVIVNLRASSIAAQKHFILTNLIRRKNA